MQQPIPQFVDKIVDYSSEYPGWSVNNVCGTPNTYPKYGDLKTAWAPSSTGKEEFLVVQFKTAVYPQGVEIYETYNCGAVVKILSYNYMAKDWAILWQGPAECGKLPSQARIFKPPVAQLQFPTNRIKIEIDGRNASGYPEIDALRLIGVPAPEFVQPAEESKQWANKVIGYSSEYSNSSWSANQVLGASNTYPKYGDNSTAWAPKTVGQKEFLELEFPDEVFPTGIEIYETYNCGSVVAIKAFNPGMGMWTPLWQGPSEVMSLQGKDKSRIFSPPLAQTGLKVKRIRIEMDGTGASGYCELDAVRLIGWTGNAPVNNQPPMMNPLPPHTPTPTPQPYPPQQGFPPQQGYPQQPFGQYPPQPYGQFPPQQFPPQQFPPQQFPPQPFPAPVPVQQPPQPAPPKEGSLQQWPSGRFYIRSRLNGLVLDAKGEGTKQGTDVILWPQKTDTRIKNQIWIFEQGGVIRNEHNKLCLDIKGATGPELCLWSYHGKPNQLWMWDGVHLQSKMNGKFVDVKGAALKSGTPAIVWQSNNGKNQEWDLIPFSG